MSQVYLLFCIRPETPICDEVVNGMEGTEG